MSQARLARQEERGWPVGLDCVELLQETVQMQLAWFHGDGSGPFNDYAAAAARHSSASRASMPSFQ